MQNHFHWPYISHTTHNQTFEQPETRRSLCEGAELRNIWTEAGHNRRRVSGASFLCITFEFVLVVAHVSVWFCVLEVLHQRCCFLPFHVLAWKVQFPLYEPSALSAPELTSTNSVGQGLRPHLSGHSSKFSQTFVNLDLRASVWLPWGFGRI